MGIETLSARIANILLLSQEPAKKIDFTRTKEEAPRKEGEVFKPAPSELTAPATVPVPAEEQPIAETPVPAAEPSAADTSPVTPPAQTPPPATVSVSTPIRTSSTDKIYSKYWNLSPTFRFNISQVTAGGDAKTDSSEMESTLNSRMPFLKLSLSPWNNSIPETYDIFGNRIISTPRSYLIPNAELTYAKNYSVEEPDYDLSGKGSLSLYIHIDDMSGENSDHTAVISLNGRSGVFKRKWPSLSAPSGYERGGGLSAGFIYNFRNWLELRPILTSDVSFRRYYEENFGQDTETFEAGLFAGAELYFKYFNILDRRAPTIGINGSRSLKATQQVPILDDPLRKDYRDYNEWRAGGGFYWGERVANLTLKGGYERKELTGFNSIWKAQGTASAEISRLGLLELTAGRAKGGYHFYSIDTPWFVDAEWTAPESITPDTGNLQSNWGLDFSVAKFRDNQIQERPEYDLYGVNFFLEGRY